MILQLSVIPQAEREIHSRSHTKSPWITATKWYSDLNLKFKRRFWAETIAPETLDHEIWAVNGRASQDRGRKQVLTNVQADYGGAGHWSRRQKLTRRRRGRRRWERNKKRITCFVASLAIFWFSLFFLNGDGLWWAPSGSMEGPPFLHGWPQNEDTAIGCFWEEKPLGMSRFSCCLFLFFFSTNQYLVQILLNYGRKLYQENRSNKCNIIIFDMIKKIM